MSQSPYQSPQKPAGSRQPTNHAKIPGIILLVLGVIWLLFVLVAIPLNIYGLLNQQMPAGMDPAQAQGFAVGQMVGAIVGGIVYLAGSIVAILGGSAMMGGKKYSLAKASAITACIPCVTPCFLLGIPFGIWGLVALSNPDTKAFFKRNS